MLSKIKEKIKKWIGDITNKNEPSSPFNPPVTIAPSPLGSSPNFVVSGIAPNSKMRGSAQSYGEAVLNSLFKSIQKKTIKRIDECCIAYLNCKDLKDLKITEWDRVDVDWDMWPIWWNISVIEKYYKKFLEGDENLLMGFKNKIISIDYITLETDIVETKIEIGLEVELEEHFNV